MNATDRAKRPGLWDHGGNWLAQAAPTSPSQGGASIHA